jgi:hypothetical protein
MKAKTKTKINRLDERVQYDPIGDLRAVIADSDECAVQWVRAELRHMTKYGPPNAKDILSAIRALISMTAYELSQQQEAA